MGFFGSNDITAVDIGAGSIKVARVANANGRRPKLLSAALFELPIEAMTNGGNGEYIAELFRNNKIKGKNIVTMVPGRHLTIRNFNLPKMPQSDLREAVRWESKRHISYPLDSAVIEYLIVGENSGASDKYDILMVAAPRAGVLEHLKPFNDAGAAVIAVDANPLALRNVLRLAGSRNGENVLMVDMGAGKTEINIFKNGHLRFSRCLETGGIDITRAISELLGIGLQEAEEMKCKTGLTQTSNKEIGTLIGNRVDSLWLEIERSLTYYKSAFRESQVDRAILTGGGSLMKGLVDYLSGLYKGVMEQDSPFSFLSSGKDIRTEFEAVAPRFSAAVGLALRRV